MVPISVAPLLAQPLGAVILTEEMSQIKKLVKEVDFVGYEGQAKQSADVNILDSAPEEKKILQHYFDRFKNEVLRYESTDFDISSSWFTKMEAGESTPVHNHRNCAFSGVFYLDDDYEDSSPLNFHLDKLQQSSFLYSLPSEWNIYNCLNYLLQPQPNLLVMFPSHIYHDFDGHKSASTRHSLAINWIPVNTFGFKDSRVTISINKKENG
jgi:hypothetical protein